MSICRSTTSLNVNPPPSGKVPERIFTVSGTFLNYPLFKGLEGKRVRQMENFSPLLAVLLLTGVLGHSVLVPRSSGYREFSEG